MTPTPLQRNEKVLDSFCKENEGKVLWATNSVLKNKLKELFDSVLATQRQEVLEEVEREAENMWSNVWFPGGALEQRNRFLQLVVKIITSLKQRP